MEAARILPTPWGPPLDGYLVVQVLLAARFSGVRRAASLLPAPSYKTRIGAKLLGRIVAPIRPAVLRAEGDGGRVGQSRSRISGRVEQWMPPPFRWDSE